VALPFNITLSPEDEPSLPPYAANLASLYLGNPDPIERLLLIHGANEKLVNM